MKEKNHNSNKSSFLKLSKSSSSSSMKSSSVILNSINNNSKRNSHKNDNINNKINNISKQLLNKNQSQSQSKKSDSKSIKIDNNELNGKKDSIKKNNILTEKENPNNNIDNNKMNDDNNKPNNNKEIIKKSGIRLSRRTNTLNYRGLVSFKSFFEKNSLINFGQNRIKTKIDLSKSNNKKLLPVIKSKNTSTESEEKLKYVYSNEEYDDNKYNNNMIFSSKFSTKKKASRLIKCVKQKSSELFLLSTINNNRKKAKDLFISSFNNYKYTSTGFSISSYENSLHQTSLKFIKDKSNNNIKSSIYTKNNNNNENDNDLINNDKKNLNTINFNTIDTQSSKSNKSIKKFNSNYSNNIKKDKYIDTIPILEVKKENIIYNNNLGFLRKPKKNASTMRLKNNLMNKFQNNIINYKSSLNNKKYLKLITKNNDLEDSQKKNNLQLLFNHDNTDLKVFDYIEKDYFKNQKEKIENIILKDDFNNHSVNNTKLINIKINFLDKEITNFMEDKYESLTSNCFFILNKDILYNRENKEKEEKLYTNFKSQKIYVDNIIHMDFNKKMLKNNIKNFGFSNKIKNIDTNISLYKTKVINNKGMKTHIIQYINKHYDLFRLIYKDLIFILV